MAGNFEIKESGAAEIMVRLQGVQNDAKRQMKDLTEKAAQVGAERMRLLAPRRTGELIRRIGWTHAVFHPGGAGGGGFYEAVAGVRHYPNDYPTNVFRGTGIYGDTGMPIYPAAGNVLTLMGEARHTSNRGHLGQTPVFTRYVKGQKPQREWVNDANHAADRYVAEHIASITAGLRR